MIERAYRGCLTRVHLPVNNSYLQSKTTLNLEHTERDSPALALAPKTHNGKENGQVAENLVFGSLDSLRAKTPRQDKPFMKIITAYDLSLFF